MEGDVVLMNDIFQFVMDGENSEGRIIGHYKTSRGRPYCYERLVYFGQDREWMAALDEAVGAENAR